MTTQTSVAINDRDLQQEILDIHAHLSEFLTTHGVSAHLIESGEIRLSSILYMVYWFHRLRNNHEEQERIRHNLLGYFGSSVDNAQTVSQALFEDTTLAEQAKQYAEGLLIPVQTVDLVVMPYHSDDTDDKRVLCLERDYYPCGLALPGGIIKDEYESNELGIEASQYAALKVAGDKVLGLGDAAIYAKEVDENGVTYFVVRDEHNQKSVRIYSEDEGGYHYKESVKSVLRPSDSRHIVDTIAFRCEIEGEPSGNLVWRDKASIVSTESPLGGFSFGHHQEIVAFITSQTSVEKERLMKERDFIRGLIKSPLQSYLDLKARFDANDNNPDTSFPELFPIVDRMLADMFDDDANELCAKYPFLIGFRDKAVISLRQVTLKNRTFCPYHSTVRAIAEGVAFFDLMARQKKGFYDSLPSDQIIEHDPSKVPFASYHMYRYKYRYDQMVNMIPHEIIIPTYEPLSATDLLHVRGVPIRFVGISRDFLYVDEFEQSPEEFFMHDCNHSWRMIMEDKDAVKEGQSRQDFIQESNAFIDEYLAKIKVQPTDTEEEKELKKLKKIILFEVVHEDARPFTKEIISQYVQLKEGQPVSFEVPRIDPKTHYMDVVDTIYTGISTLSYVRNKLQHGFYDDIDAQISQIVDPKYRTARWITQAAYDMLVELQAKSGPEAALDEKGNISYEWLLQRTCAAGPDNIHGIDEIDPAVQDYGDGTEKLNPKRYQAD
ncbi:MAG: hypothetical protein WAQ27_04695 [Candidatus Microsaccharimonas sp.]